MNIRTLVAAGLLLFSSIASAITYADRSGTITTGGTSQTLAAANPTRGRIAITNFPTETEVLCVNVTSAASCSTPGSWVLAPGETIVIDSNEIVTVVAATTGHKYTAKENITDGFAINVSGSTSISGGAGDASAANQTTGNASLASIDGKLPATTAHDAAAGSVNPWLEGCYASAAAPTSVSADADAVRAWCLRNGARATQPTFAGVLAVAGSGANGTGVQRVTIATDDTIVASLATKLDTLNTSVNAATTQLPADGTGQLAMAASFPVVIASDQSTISTNVAQINGVTTLMGAGNTGTGSQRVTIATDQAAHATYGHGATGAAVPANVTAMGARAGANSVNVAQGSATAPVSMSTATTTQFVALSGSTVTYVTGIALIAGGTTNVTLVYGTGSNCVTSPSNLTGAIPLIANAGFTLGSGLGAVIVVPAGQALCITSSAGVQVSGLITYTQF